VFLVGPSADAVLPVRAPDGVGVTWLPRGALARGELLGAAVTGAALPPPAVDEEAAPLWDVSPDDVITASAERYVWLAGEAGVVTGLRRRLLAETGLDRAAVAFMGYWREGRASV
jgi:NADPH-dependent ferric siderophore reductase